jgi:hypothetical protein
MASNEPNSSIGFNEKYDPTTEDEIQVTVNSTKANESEQVEEKIENAVAECSDSSDGRPEESAEIEEGTADAAKPEPEYPTGIRFVLLTISLMLGVYMVALDTNILCLSHSLSPSKTKLTPNKQRQSQASQRNSTPFPT